MSENVVRKPVAWALFSKEIMPSGIAYAVRRVEIELAQIEADLDIQDAEIKPLFTDAFTSTERERWQMLERICAGVTQDAIDGGWTVIGMMNYAKGLERKVQSLEYQLKQLSSLHSATVNALADERSKS
jgi:hypothetical protein